MWLVRLPGITSDKITEKCLLIDKTYTLGRDVASSICVYKKFISSKQLTLSADANGKLTITMFGRTKAMVNDQKYRYNQGSNSAFEFEVSDTPIAIELGSESKGVYSFQIVWKQIVVCFSSKVSREIDMLECNMRKLGVPIEFSKEFDLKVTHFVPFCEFHSHSDETLPFSPKLILAMVRNFKIVQVEYFKQILEKAATLETKLDALGDSKVPDRVLPAGTSVLEYRFQLPDAKKFVPDPCCIGNIARSTLFNKITFVFYSRDEYDALKPAVESASGKAVLFDHALEMREKFEVFCKESKAGAKQLVIYKSADIEYISEVAYALNIAIIGNAELFEMIKAATTEKIAEKHKELEQRKDRERLSKQTISRELGINGTPEDAQSTKSSLRKRRRVGRSQIVPIDAMSLLTGGSLDTEIQETNQSKGLNGKNDKAEVSDQEISNGKIIEEKIEAIDENKSSQNESGIVMKHQSTKEKVDNETKENVDMNVEYSKKDTESAEVIGDEETQMPKRRKLIAGRKRKRVVAQAVEELYNTAPEIENVDIKGDNGTESIKTGDESLEKERAQIDVKSAPVQEMSVESGGHSGIADKSQSDTLNSGTNNSENVTDKINEGQEVIPMEENNLEVEYKNIADRVRIETMSLNPRNKSVPVDNPKWKGRKNFKTFVKVTKSTTPEETGFREYVKFERFDPASKTYDHSEEDDDANFRQQKTRSHIPDSQKLFVDSESEDGSDNGSNEPSESEKLRRVGPTFHTSNRGIKNLGSQKSNITRAGGIDSDSSDEESSVPKFKFRSS